VKLTRSVKAVTGARWFWEGEIRARRFRNKSEMAIIRSRSSLLMMPVLPPESMEAEIAEIWEKPARTKPLMTVGDPVPPPIVTIWGLANVVVILNQGYKKNYVRMGKWRNKNRRDSKLN
jgi:hypothetical protein